VRNLSQDSRYPSRDSNHTPTEYKLEALGLEPLRSETILDKNFVISNKRLNSEFTDDLLVIGVEPYCIFLPHL
jgi:hypothetical protein